MNITKELESKCLDGNCPPTEEIREIVLSKMEKKAIFYSMQIQIDAVRQSLA